MKSRWWFVLLAAAVVLTVGGLFLWRQVQAEDESRLWGNAPPGAPDQKLVKR